MPPPQKASMRSSDHFSKGKRARPSGTHSLEVPLRTCPEYAPKDAPRLDASFACSSSGRNRKAHPVPFHVIGIPEGQRQTIQSSPMGSPSPSQPAAHFTCRTRRTGELVGGCARESLPERERLPVGGKTHATENKGRYASHDTYDVIQPRR